MLGRMIRLVACLVLLLPLPTARADPATWTTDPLVGASEITLTIDITCSGSIICGFIPAYESTRTAALSGSGTATLSQGLLQFQLDQLVDPPALDAFVLAIAETTFDPTPSNGTPTVENGIVFFSDGGPFLAPGLGPPPSGPVAIAEDLDHGLRFDLRGLEAQSLEVPFFDQVVGPAPETFSGEFEMIDSRRFVVRGLTASFAGSSDNALDPGTLTVGTSGTITLNLSGALIEEVPLPRFALAGLLLALLAGVVSSRRGPAR
jgi:hypothetical protein